MKKRVLQMRVVKEEKDDGSQTLTIPDPSFDNMVKTITHAVEKTIKTIGVAAVGYIVVDTVRQVLVAKASSQ
jgi:hypothetical protein